MLRQWCETPVCFRRADKMEMTKITTIRCMYVKIKFLFFFAFASSEAAHKQHAHIHQTDKKKYEWLYFKFVHATAFSTLSLLFDDIRWGWLPLPAAASSHLAHLYLCMRYLIIICIFPWRIVFAVLVKISFPLACFSYFSALFRFQSRISFHYADCAVHLFIHPCIRSLHT